MAGHLAFGLIASTPSSRHASDLPSMPGSGRSLPVLTQLLNLSQDISVTALVARLAKR
ncbi:MAG: hypothetical protein ABSA51_02825 [Anaerolineaceae bacterium]